MESGIRVSPLVMQHQEHDLRIGSRFLIRVQRLEALHGL